MAPVQREDDRVDTSYRGIKDYLSRVEGGMSEDETRWQFALLTFSNELESVGDLIEKNLCDLLRKQTADGTMRGGSQSTAFLAGKESLNEWCRDAERAHYDRLRRGGGALAASAYFLDPFEGFRRIDSHISAIGYAFAPPPSRRSRAKSNLPAAAPTVQPQNAPGV